ncbi:LOW QUALITY PROTEIN: T-cell surface protein tactile [Trichechus inunguis]
MDLRDQVDPYDSGNQCLKGLFLKIEVWEERVNAGEDIYVPPGSNVNLTYQIEKKKKKPFLVQMQWSKVTNKVDLIVLYHLFDCANESPCGSLVTFKETHGNVKMTLHLRNVTSLSGMYECSFTLYLEGTKIYNLLIQTNVTQDEWRSSHTIEIEVNWTLEIPCFQNISSEVSPAFTFTWLVVRDNGTQETLITQDHTISNSTLFKNRIKEARPR